MQKLLNSFSINKGAGGGTLMFDPLDERITSIRQRIAKFKRDYPELYKSEINEKEVMSAYWKTFHSLNGSTLREEDEQRELQQHTTRKDFSQADELKRALSSKKKSITI